MTDTTPLRIQTNTQVRLAPRVAKRSARLNTVTVHAAREAGLKPDGTSATGRKPNPAFAQEDGKLWVCQGCGYIYDGSIGKWGEAKKCPACGERRFALKTQNEMNIAAGSVGVVALLVAALFALVKLA
jgi:Zn finger protein HypA/HybF involved in hydrogenase expression